MITQFHQNVLTIELHSVPHSHQGSYSIKKSHPRTDMDDLEEQVLLHQANVTTNHGEA